MSINLLIADDSATIHKVVGLAFEGEDVTVLSAGNGEEALKKAKELSLDIVFADTDMPELDGFQLCQKIKEDEKLKKIPVCLIHSDYEEFDEKKYRACGAEGHLPKPFKSEDIVNKVAEITGLSGKNKDVEVKPDVQTGKNIMENEDNQTEDSEELEILSLDDDDDSLDDDDSIELMLEDSVDSPAPEEKSDQDPSEEEIEDFMEDIEEISDDDLTMESGPGKTVGVSTEESKVKIDDDIEKELEEFNLALDIPEEEIGEAGPFVEDKSAASEELIVADSGKEELEDTAEILEKETPQKITDMESIGDDILEEKEDLIEGAGIIHDNGGLEAGHAGGAGVKASTGKSKQLTEDEFEKLIGSYIKKVIEKVLKEAIQGEISNITDKIIDAVERIAREITPDISKTIIQKEIEKIKSSEN